MLFCVLPLLVFCRKETVLHGRQCFARLVRVLLGDTAISDDKCECGPSLVVLGVRIELSAKGYTLKPAEEKVVGVVAVGLHVVF